MVLIPLGEQGLLSDKFESTGCPAWKLGNSTAYNSKSICLRRKILVATVTLLAYMSFFKIKKFEKIAMVQKNIREGATDEVHRKSPNWLYFAFRDHKSDRIYEWISFVGQIRVFD